MWQFKQTMLDLLFKKTPSRYYSKFFNASKNSSKNNNSSFFKFRNSFTPMVFSYMSRRNIFYVTFKKKTGPHTFEPCTVSLGLLKKGAVLPVLTVKAFFQLIAFDSNPRPSMAHFINLYNAFVRNPQNSAFVIDQAYITFGRGGHRKISITGDGLIAFAKENQRAFQLCRYTLNSFVSSILEGLSSLDSSINVAKNRPLPSRENLHEDVLYRELCKNTILDPSSFVHIELQALLLTQNIFYIMEMEDLYFRAGFSLDY
jgi:hypothetical protein